MLQGTPALWRSLVSAGWQGHGGAWGRWRFVFPVESRCKQTVVESGYLLQSVLAVVLCHVSFCMFFDIHLI